MCCTRTAGRNLAAGNSLLLHRYGMAGSMGRVGAAGDNAAMESLSALLHKYVLNRHRRATREALRITVRETTSTTNHGEQVTTVTMQDGSKHVLTKRNPFDGPSKQNFVVLEDFDKHGNLVSTTSSWHDLANSRDYTTISWPDGSHWTMSMDPSGYRTASSITADGRESSVPVEVIDNISTGTGSMMSGLEKHVGRGGGLPMLTEETLAKVGKTTKFGGPALAVATTIFDMAMADSTHDRCVAAVAGAAGGGGGWGGAELGAFLGAFTGPAAPVAVPALALLLGAGGAVGGSGLGKFVGDVVCPY